MGRAVLEVQRTQQGQIATLCRLFVCSLNGLRERLASNHSSSRYRGPRSPRTHPCSLCNRLGHWKRQCPLRYSPGHKGRNNHPPSLPIHSDYDTPALADATTTHSGSGPVTPHGLRSAGPFSSSFPASPNSDSRGTPVLTPVTPVLPSAPATDVHVPPPVSVLLPTPGAARAESPVTPPVPVPRTSVTPPVPDPRTSVTPPVPDPRTSVTPPVPVLPTTSTTIPTTSPRRRPSRRQNRPEHMNTSISIPDYVPLSYSDSETDHLHPNVCQDCSQDEGLTGQGPPSDGPGPRGESLEVDPSPPPLRNLCHPTGRFYVSLGVSVGSLTTGECGRLALFPELGSGVAAFFSSMGPVVPSERWALLVPSPSCSHGTPAKHEPWGPTSQANGISTISLSHYHAPPRHVVLITTNRRESQIEREKPGRYSHRVSVVIFQGKISKTARVVGLVETTSFPSQRATRKSTPAFRASRKPRADQDQ
ncbi:hypothetical protein Bbelb_029210 [Branchiostoma belcheri]|nr:hypothetical protein Bbelb_029210 [Branchiostoma belcheri]